MKHKNTGSIAHKNTGYNNHTNTYNNHTNNYKQVYNQYGNYKENYYNYSEYSQSSYSDYSAFRGIISDIIKEDFSINKNALRYGNHGQNYYSQSSYTQSGSGTSNYKQYIQSGYNNHTNAGYTNHIDINENVEPSVIGTVKDWTSAYYKDSLNIIWEKATDNNKCISVLSASYGDINETSVGIFENNIKKSSISRGITIAYWNTSGVYQGALSKDTYEDINLLNDIKNYYNNIANGSIIVIGSYDAIGSDENVATVKTWLTSIGVSSASVLEGTRSAFACILNKGTGILSQQSYRYGLGPTTAGCCTAKYTIHNVSSSQTITYILEYAFKGINDSAYGNWTRLGNTTSTSYFYNLSNHTNGFIKFRIIANDGVENSLQWKESKEVRVLKYQKPIISIDEKIKAIDVKTVDLEIEKLNTAIGTTNNNLDITYDKIIPKNDIVSLRNKINNINRTLALGELGDKNVDIIYKADIENIKKNIEKI